MPKIPCNIRIVSFSDGKKVVYESEGEYEKGEDGTKIRYFQDSSPVTLHARPDGIVAMRREGDCFLEMNFSENEESRGIFGVSESSGKNYRGELVLFTESIKYSETERSLASLLLKYAIRYESGEQKFTVRLCVAAKENHEES